jgi:Caspase domain
MSGSVQNIEDRPPPGPGKLPHELDFGLVIGIDHYSGAPPLRCAVKDAIEFCAWLCDANGGGLAKQHVELVESQQKPIAPLQKEVDRALRTIEAAARAAKGGRRLYFHFSGHGAGNPESQDVALILAKWSRSRLKFALSRDDYGEGLRRAGLFDELVFSLDCCRTTAERAIGSAPSFALEPHRKPPRTRVFTAYATEDGHPAFEERGHGVFTECWLASLRSWPHGITAGHLQTELHHALTLRGQRPHIVSDLIPDSKFGSSGAPPNLIIEFHAARGRVRLLDGWFEEVAACDVSRAPDGAPHPRIWELVIRPGMYKLEDGAGHAARFDHNKAVTHVVL